jgi:electron transfer flavoprotein beta subunit
MKAIVAVKRVIDYNVKVRVKADNSDVDLANTKMSINPFCEIAVEEAVRLKEAGTVSEIVVVSVGPKAVQEQMRYAMALGADRGIQVETETSPSSLDVARLLAKINEEESADLFILGKQAIDSDNNQTGQMLAALLDIPQATFASEVKIADGKAEVTREVDGGLVTLEMDLPAVVTTDLRLNEPRFAALPKIMQAKRKPLAVKTVEELGVTLSNSTELLSVEPPAERQAGIKVGSVDELLDKLRNDAQFL